MLRKILAVAWALALAASAAWLAKELPRASPESSIFALLPQRTDSPRAQPGSLARSASALLRSEAEKRFLVLLIDADADKAARAAEAYAARLKRSPGIAEAVCAVPPEGPGRMLDFFFPHRFRLLAPGDRAALERDTGSSYALYDMAKRSLYLPPGVSGGLGFGQDPFGTFGRWMASHASAGGGLALQGGHLTAQVEGRTAVAVLGMLGPRARGMEAQNALSAAFDSAAAAARAFSGGGLLRSGFIFHELAAARQAHKEMTSIGTVSAVLLLILMLIVFRGIRPTLLGFLPVAVGCLAATAALLCLWGGKVHLIAMVFGSTIVGVAEDYGMLFIAGLYEEGPWDSVKRMAEVGRSIFLGMLTSVAGYLALFFVPIPGLRQIGIFSITGLVASWITVALWYPWLAAGLRPMGPGARRAAASVAARWPNASGSRTTAFALIALLAASLWGCLRLRVDDDVRLLYAQDPVLRAEQDRAAAAVRMPGTGRFFLVRKPEGRPDGEQGILESEEKLLDTLAKADAGGSGITGVTSFVPSAARQRADLDLLGKPLLGSAGRPGLAARLAAELETPDLAGRLAENLHAGSQPLTVAAWLGDPASLPFRHFWHDAYAVVPLPGDLNLDAAALRAIARAAGPNVELVDQLQEVTDTLAFLRRHLVWVLLIGAALVAAALIPLFRLRAPGALAPAILGVAAGLGCLGFSGLPLNLFALLALALILGMGIDYGIFVQESRRRQASALVAINLGAATNMIAFGMLAFSTTPALKAFGLVLGAGLGVAWLTAPCFAPSSEGNPHAP
jgi:predicted exporter